MSVLRSRVADFVGKSYNRLTILPDILPIGRRTKVMAICDCGVIKEYRLNSITSGTTQSCGCIHSEKVGKHGLREHPLYGVWASMIQRCYDSNANSYKNYGGSGVTVSEMWRHNFVAFYDWAIDKWKPGLQIDKDIRSGCQTGKLYCPECCCFVTPLQNNRRRRNTVMLTCRGESKSLSEWCEQTGSNYILVINRVRNGWDHERALIEPVDKKYSH